MKEYSQVRYWVNDLPKLGSTSFSLDEVKKQFPEKPPEQIKNALGRLVAAGEIISVWKGFYAVVLPEYGMKGFVPPSEYIDFLMKQLDNDYYIALLSAAALQGASHQQPQAFTFVCDRILHPKVKQGVRLEPIFKKSLPGKYVMKKNVRSGTVQISVPELTALDLFLYPHRVGGINRIATVLSELAENLNFDRVDDDFFREIPSGAFQRLGYLLDIEPEKKTLADNLLERCRAVGMRFRKVPLALPAGDYAANGEIDEKWKIIINCEVESDV